MKRLISTNKFAEETQKIIDKKTIDKIIKQITEEYNFLYNNKNQVSGYEEAVTEGDTIIRNPKNKPFLKELILARGDFFTSDRELAALAFALDDFDMLGNYGVINYWI